MDIALFKLPAGTTSSLPPICRFGSAEPQLEQKHLVCCVDGKVNKVVWLSPEIHLRVAVEENKLAA